MLIVFKGLRCKVPHPHIHVCWCCNRGNTYTNVFRANTDHLHAFKAHIYIKQSATWFTLIAHLLTCLSPHIGCRTKWLCRRSRAVLGFQLCFDTMSSVFHTVKRGTVARLSTLFFLFCFFPTQPLWCILWVFFSPARCFHSVAGPCSGPCDSYSQTNRDKHGRASGCRVSWSGLNFFVVV